MSATAKTRIVPGQEGAGFFMEGCCLSIALIFRFRAIPDDLPSYLQSIKLVFLPAKHSMAGNGGPPSSVLLQKDKSMKYHKLSICFLFLLVFAFQLAACAQQAAEPLKPGMTNEQIANYIRKAFNVPNKVTITVKENADSKAIPGTYPIMVEFKGEQVNQTQEAWVTKENVLIVGRTFDMSVDPYKKNWDKINLTNNVPMTGPADAKVTIVEYSDFQCPYCSRAHVTVKELLKQYDGKIKVAYKHLPLTNIHNWAESAALASVCVYKQKPDAFWQFSDYFFTNQQTIKAETFDAKLQEFSTQSGLKYDDLKKCMADPETKQKVSADTAEAGKLGLSSTPSFVINGKTVVGAVPLEDFKQAIDEAMTTASK
jgi:protein-disulfide isomerase